MKSNSPRSNSPKAAQARTGPHRLSRRKRLQAAVLAVIASTLPACGGNKWHMQVGPAHMDDTGAPALGFKFPGVADPDLINYLEGDLPIVP